MNKTPIIIIDNDITFREILSRSLINLNCQVTHFPHPADALHAISTHDHSDGQQLNVLLDLKLESDTGLRWITEILKVNKHCRIVLITGYASITTAVEAIKLGADDYLAKPITAREILSNLQKQQIDPTITINESPMSIDRLEWEHIHKVLHDNDGNISASARALGMHRRTLQRKLAKKPVRK